jgi:hypothetical protein
VYMISWIRVLVALKPEGMSYLFHLFGIFQFLLFPFLFYITFVEACYLVLLIRV